VKRASGERAVPSAAARAFVPNVVAGDAAPPDAGECSDAAGSALPFVDEAEYLEAQIGRIRLLAERALALGAGQREEAARLFGRAEAARREIAQRVARSASDGGEPPFGLERLRMRFGLDAEDVDLLLHTAATTLDPQLGKLHTKLAGAAFHPWLDVGLAISLHHDDLASRLRARARFQPQAPLVAHRLLLLDRTRPEAKENLLACELKLPSRVARLVLGSDPTGGAIAIGKLTTPEPTLDEVVLADDVRTQLEQLLGAAPGLDRKLSEWGYEKLLPEGRAMTVLIAGGGGTGKTLLAQAISHRLGRPLLSVDAARLVEAGSRLELELDELLLEQRLHDAVLLFDSCELVLGRGASRIGVLLAAIERATGLVLLCSSRPERLDSQLDRRVMVRLQLELPTPPLRLQLWRRLLSPAVPIASEVDLPAVAKRYELTGGAIRSAVLYAVSRAIARGGEAQLLQTDLEQAAQAQLRGDLSAYADKTRAQQLSLDVLILQPDEKQQIVEIIDAGRHRAEVLYNWGFSDKLATGKGLVALFSGDPGTGKTLAAEVIAAELKLPLHRVNPAKVVSKYVGETEKNLNEILAQAKSTHSILFFDEADALFATRVQKVESANDRFVNMETNFLLQQLERYEGIVILATNLETSIDQAFKRRIAYHVVLTFPKAPDRERIWRVLIPSRAPVGEIDFEHLGKTFELSGGHIKNAILRASYAAAAAKRSLDTALLADAAEKECAAAGKLFHNQALPARGVRRRDGR
jgi:SpoVK/Ycf46/Vps4 family AAA+-type ATPase